MRWRGSAKPADAESDRTRRWPAAQPESCEFRRLPEPGSTGVRGGLQAFGLHQFRLVVGSRGGRRRQQLLELVLPERITAQRRSPPPPLPPSAPPSSSPSSRAVARGLRLGLLRERFPAVADDADRRCERRRHSECHWRQHRSGRLELLPRTRFRRLPGMIPSDIHVSRTIVMF